MGQAKAKNFKVNDEQKSCSILYDSIMCAYYTCVAVAISSRTLYNKGGAKLIAAGASRGGVEDLTAHKRRLKVVTLTFQSGPLGIDSLYLYTFCNFFCFRFETERN
jgi:hypothetical protein